MWSNGGMTLTVEDGSTQLKAFTGGTLCTKNVKLTDLRMNARLLVESPATEDFTWHILSSVVDFTCKGNIVTKMSSPV